MTDSKPFSNAHHNEDKVRGSAAYELFVSISTIFSLVVVVLLFSSPPKSEYRQILVGVDTIFCVIFAVDSFRSLITAPDKPVYLKWGWLDFLGSVPSFFILRFARLARLARILSNFRAKSRQEIIEEATDKRAESTFLFTIVLGVFLITLGSIFVLFFERRTPGANIQNAADAFWWAYVTITTVGYGDHYPNSIAGRLIAIVMMTFGFAIFGVFTSYLASHFVKYERDDTRDELNQIKKELDEIKRMLQERDGIEVNGTEYNDNRVGEEYDRS
jgi:voltage-gated potassium channel